MESFRGEMERKGEPGGSWRPSPRTLSGKASRQVEGDLPAWGGRGWSTEKPQLAPCQPPPSRGLTLLPSRQFSPKRYLVNSWQIETPFHSAKRVNHRGVSLLGRGTSVLSEKPLSMPFASKLRPALCPLPGDVPH